MISLGNIVRYSQYSHSLWYTHGIRPINLCLNGICSKIHIYCTMLQVILTPTCRVSGYPQQVIKVDAAETTTVYITALPTVITLNNYTTRHL
jgi:hypothetical protein